MKKLLILMLLFSHIASVWAIDEPKVTREDIKRDTWTVGGFYEGVIGSAPFQMNIEYPNGPHHKDIWFEGQYWYPKQVTNARFPIKIASSGPDGSFKIEAIVKCDNGDSSRCHKEYFTGKWNAQKTEAQGSWSSETSGKTLPFHMVLKARYQGEWLSYLTSTSKDLFQDRRTIHSVIYPVAQDKTLAGQINVLLSDSAKLRADPNDDLDNQETENTLLIVWASTNELSMRLDNSFYGFGAAHPLGGESYTHLIKAENGYRLVKKDELLDGGQACIQKLSGTIVDALTKDNASNPLAGALVQPEPDPGMVKKKKHVHVTTPRPDNPWSNYLFSPLGVEIYFGEYSIGGYAEVHDIFINKNRLGTCIHNLPQYTPVGNL